MISDEESKPVPIYSVLMDEVPVRIQNMLLSHNPELMDMKYLLKHKDEYLSITPDDFIAI
jgi:hypothetical protein